MYGAILGDMVGAPYEFDRGNKSKDFEMWNRKVRFTDDTVMTIAVADAILTAGIDAEEKEIKKVLVEKMQQWGNRYPNSGYGGRFIHWLGSRNPKPYGSYGNGSAMRVSSVGWFYDTLEKTRKVARWTAEVSHNHPEGIKGAEATASVIFMARHGATKEEIKEYVEKEFEYDLSRTCEEIRPGYYHDESCQKTVPEAITAFLEGEDFEDVIRTAISLGGDCDTLTCIAGGMAEAFYGIPVGMIQNTCDRLGEDMMKVLKEFDEQRNGSSVDPFLKGNEVIAAAIEQFRKETTNENLAVVASAFCQRIKAGGRFIVPVIAPDALVNMVDPENVKVGDEFTSEEELSFKFQHLEGDDGEIWAVAFTSREEYLKGASSDTLVMDIEQLLEGFADDVGETGIIINPWSENLLLRKDLIKAIVKMAKEDK
ncbi:ADP-ribosylglycohydrolase family protein [Butyrivibrio proteoclasticus]|uniref:ADP-ribosylglycohydrolase family protein n=1 Tax=Butyrivibrio proteoclasticus TaxID=43305 RepID=UPI00047B2274|nr:ADP-ribosylglycohydrolase family protein [Butyrivibrio proteoclasticus]